MDSLLQDVRYALATLRRNPGFALAGLLTLALGIGATTAVYSVLHGVLLKPLPYPNPERLVRLWEEHPGGTTVAGLRWLSHRTYYAWLDRSTTLADLGAYAQYEYNVQFGDEPARIFGGQFTPSVFGMLGATPALGRFFGPEEAVDGAEPVVVISDRLWRERYGTDGAVIGKQLVIDQRSYTIIGVARPELDFPQRRVLFWIPYVVLRVQDNPRRTFAFSAIGRLKPGVSLQQAEAEGTAAARSMPRPMSADLFFGKGGPPVVHARQLADDVTLSVRPALQVLAAGVALVLLVACANVANLFLSRGVARQRELAVRAAIGAGRWRIARQLLTESAVLSLSGGLAGLLLAWALMRLLPALAPAGFPRLENVQLDARVIVFAVSASIFTALAAGLAPAIRGTRFRLAESLQGGDGSTAGGFRGRRARRLRDVLLIVESAFAVILLVGAALLGHSFVRLMRVDPGYDADHVLMARVSLPRNSPRERMSQLLETLLPRLRALPGVTAAGAGSMMPLMSMTAITTFPLPPDAGRGKPTTTRSLTYMVTPGYAEALRLRLREGRFFTDGDTAPGLRAMIVNDEFVRQYLSNDPAIGRRFENVYADDKSVTTEIVGIVGTVLKDGNDREPQPEIYFVHGSPTRRMIGFANIVVRTSDDPSRVAPALRDVIRSADTAAIVERIEPLSAMVSASVEQPRFATMVLGAFAALAVALASVGLYGVLSYGVAQRRRELALRAALGARRADLVGLVLREGLLVTIAGAALGLVAATGLTRWMQGVLFGVTPLDAVSFAFAPLVLLPVAVAACLLPARRAGATDPAIALRGD
jgi:predicted permease